MNYKIILNFIYLSDDIRTNIHTFLGGIKSGIISTTPRDNGG